MIDEATIQEAGRLLRQAAPRGSRVILFGSYARGDARSHSDLDFLVVEPVVADQHGEMVRLRDALRPLHVRADVLVVSASVFADWSDTPNNVLYEASKEGRVLMKWDEQARLLRRKSAEDEDVVTILLANPASPDSAIGFHGQQAVEKLLKALFSHRRVMFEKTHDLIELMDLLTANGIAVPDEVDQCRRLQPYAVRFRYADSPAEPSIRLDRAWLPECIGRVRQWVDGFLDQPPSS